MVGQWRARRVRRRRREARRRARRRSIRAQIVGEVTSPQASTQMRHATVRNGNSYARARRLWIGGMPVGVKHFTSLHFTTFPVFLNATAI